MKKYLHIIAPAAVLAVLVLLISLLVQKEVRQENREYRMHFSGMLEREAAISARLDSLRVLEDSTRKILPDRAMVVCVDDIIENQ